MPDRISRRALLNASAAGTIAAVGSQSAQATIRGSASVQEPGRSVPVVGDFDVLVCGGGPAGMAAAITAARAGATVQILEGHGCLGGVWTSGLLSYVVDANKPGLNRELVARLDALDGRRSHGKRCYLYDVETMKYVLEEYCRELGISVQMHTHVVGVEMDDSKRIRGVVTESKSGRQAWRAHSVIDTTGDGDVGALAGCEWQFGRDRDCPCQPMSLMGIIEASPQALAAFDAHATDTNKDRFRDEIQRAGFDPTYGKPTLWYMHGHIAAIMLNHEYGVRPFDAAAVTEATMNARKELFETMRALQKLGGPWEGCRLVSTAEQIGVRDGRRIKGRYFVDTSDVVRGARHDDAVARSTILVDIHAPTLEANKTQPWSTGGIEAQPFDIPLRALIAKDVDGLMMAGRCISGDFIAHASYRVTGNAVAMGEAAGITAAAAAADHRLPHEVPWAVVGHQLQKLR